MHCICMVTDFFHPNKGGVETHILSLSESLQRLGHKVVVVTHAYDDDLHRGETVLDSIGLKVYYLPLPVCYDQVILPTACSWLASFRRILTSENISIVHGHQSTSTMCHEGLLFARVLGYRVCYTEHSLFGLTDTSSICVNAILNMTLRDIDHAIAVSNACKESLAVRSRVKYEHISTIPNAVDALKFRPDAEASFTLEEVSSNFNASANPTIKISKCREIEREAKTTSSSARHLQTSYSTRTITVVMICRLEYRKGIGLFAAALPQICAAHPTVRFLIGGDGRMRCLLDETVLEHGLGDRVELLGELDHSMVRSVLLRGHLFLNTSYTESFGVALLEAAACGLHVVSTCVGGIPEVLPPDMITFTSPEDATSSESLVDALTRGLAKLAREDKYILASANTISPENVSPSREIQSVNRSGCEGAENECEETKPTYMRMLRACANVRYEMALVRHRRITGLYSWTQTAMSTVKVYDAITAMPTPTPWRSLRHYMSAGPVSGPFICALFLLLSLVRYLLDWSQPEDGILEANIAKPKAVVMRR
jgi:phosphatidylinositol glycan class A protein